MLTNHKNIPCHPFTIFLPTGLIPDLLNLIMGKCCFGCAEIIYRGPVDPIQKFQLTEDDDVTIYMPVSAPYTANMFLDHDYVAFVR